MIQAALDLRLCELAEVLGGFLATSEEILLKTRKRFGDTQQLPVSTASGADRVSKTDLFPHAPPAPNTLWALMASGWRCCLREPSLVHLMSPELWASPKEAMHSLFLCKISVLEERI